ncbi:MAG TPA: polyprenol monophosphomannose synthase [Candidatus Saccharimonadales bacterium]
MKRIAIATPTYNEAGNIKKLILEIEKVCKNIPDISFTLFVIDDSSPDGTAKIAQETAKKVKTTNFSVKVLVRKIKDGIGRAYIYGFNEILKGKFDYIIQIDADLSHDPKYIKDLVDQARIGKDFVSASRYMKGGGIADWGLHRRILSRGGNIYTRLFLDKRITDYTNGLNMYSVPLMKEINIDTLDSDGYGFFIELKHKILPLSRNYGQIPLILTDRKHGKSKIPRNTILINLALVPKLHFKKK